MPIAKTAGVRLAVEGIERDVGSSRFLCLELRDVRIPKKLFEFQGFSVGTWPSKPLRPQPNRSRGVG